MKVTNTNSSRSVSSSTLKNDVSNSYNKMSMRRYHSLREVIGIHYTPININTFRGLRRILLVAFVLILGLFSIHLAVVQRGGMNEVELLNELMEKSRLAYANSVLYSRQNSSRNPNSRPGHVLKTQGATAKYPVILIPGFITSGLELWSGEECAKTYFRQRLWGSLPVFMQTFFTDNECWRRHLSLDPETGMDPENIRLRSAQGFEAADYVMSTYWVWEKIIENLADVGYDSSNMLMMPYDWRLSFAVLETRDGYLTKLKMNIEAMVKTSGIKVVLTSHSMGSQIVLFFFKWVVTSEKEGGGGGGKDWVEKHVHSFVNVSGPILGVPKAATALLSGEMKDTAAIMGKMGSLVEVIFGRSNRKELWKTWGSIWAMLPKGGNAIWSNANDIIQQQSVSMETDFSSGVCEELSLDEKICPETDNVISSHAFITFNATSQNGDKNMTFWSVKDSIDYLRQWGYSSRNSAHAAQMHQFHKEGKITVENWHDPTVTPLPNAPSMKMYCLYGVGIETERSYFYKQTKENNQSEDLPFVIDPSVNDFKENIRFGTRFSDGDVSVPLVSLGYMCVDGWIDSKLNPSKLGIITREYLHAEEFIVNDPMRSGPHSADHVDILGNLDTTLDLLKIVTDFNVASIDDNKIHSSIREIASRISPHVDFKRKRRKF